jgi:hypothetical protein
MLSPTLGFCEHHIKSSEAFTKKLHSINLQNTNIQITFDVVYLFTKGPLEYSLHVLVKHLEAKTKDYYIYFLPLLWQIILPGR